MTLLKLHMAQDLLRLHKSMRGDIVGAVRTMHTCSALTETQSKSRIH